jgi:hypothetical protein
MMHYGGVSQGNLTKKVSDEKFVFVAISFAEASERI